MNTRLYGILSRLASPFSLPLLKKLGKEPLMLPVYHLSTDHPAPHIRPLYPIRDTRTFRADLDVFLKHYVPWSLDDLYQWVLGGNKKGGRPGFHITFDDGLRQIYDEVAPILEEKGVPATFFVNPDFVGNEKLFFRFKAALLVDKLSQSSSQVSWIKELDSLLQQNGYLEGRISQRLLRVGYGQAALLDRMGEVAELDFAGFLEEYRPYMTWEQINDLTQRGFSIGAHSLDHPEYRFLSLEEQIRQTSESLRYVREKVNTPLESFAFPFTDFGVSRAFFAQFGLENDQAQPSVTMGSAGLKTDSFARHVQRLPMEGPTDDATTILKSHYLYYLLKMPLGKNRIHRT